MKMECNCKFKIVQTNNWKTPKPIDACWGLQCKKCGKVICIGYTKLELKK